MSYRRKSLLIGINYFGSKNQLQGCISDVHNMIGFLSWVGYPRDGGSQVILTDDQQGPYYPNGHNILAAMDWLVSEPNTACFLHYSGHGGQVQDPTGSRPTGYADTIVPVDFQQNGQIDSTVLHRHLVTALHPSSSLFVVLDCCHSGSALELPYVYRTDDEGRVSLMSNVEAGMRLMGQADHLLQGDFVLDPRTMGDVKQLYAGARDFFRGFRHEGEQHQAPGLRADGGGNWTNERKFVTMFSGCKDEQTSADATIGGAHVGAMSWAFLKCLGGGTPMSYLQVLQATRQILRDSSYQQIPQLSVGVEDMQLDQPLRI